MSNPLLSIIIPCFNASKTIEATLRSINEQTFDNYEVLIVDGLSTDNTKKIVEQYLKENHRIKWISEPDKGIYDAMNKGIKLSKGKWLYFLGTDDTFSNNDVVLTVSTIMNETDAFVMYGNVKMNGGSGWAKDGEIYAGEFDLKKLLAQNICHQAIFYKKEVFDGIGPFNIRYKICGDWDFNLHCFSKYKFYYINIIVANYNGGGTSSVAEDTNFSKDKIYNIASYFKNRLYVNEFVQFRTYFRRMIFQKNVPMGLGGRIRLLLFSIILKLKKER